MYTLGYELVHIKSVPRFNKKAKQGMVFTLYWIESHVSIVVGYLKEDHENNIVQVKYNNANEIDKMTYMLWNIIASNDNIFWR